MQGTFLRKLISGQTNYLQARHAVLTGNLANADTPGYKPKDIASPDFAALVDRATKKRSPIGLERTNTEHLAATTIRQFNGQGRTVGGYEISPAGNAVVIEEQAQKLQETRLQYELTTGIYTKLKGIMRTALGSNGA